MQCTKHKKLDSLETLQCALEHKCLLHGQSPKIVKFVMNQDWQKVDHGKEFCISLIIQKKDTGGTLSMLAKQMDECMTKMMPWSISKTKESPTQKLWTKLHHEDWN